MNGLILFISAIILAETSVLLVKNRKTPLLNPNKRKVYVDTSALMDVRLLAIAETGFIGDDLIIPRSVIRELQLLADGKDSEKRSRARAALDAVSQLERVVYFDTTILEDALDRTPVDERLLELAKANHGLILTNDYNLNKVAATEKIDALNINDLALALRGDFLPGERTTVKIVSTGEGPHQGVGYLTDGTMVVVDRADKNVGEEIEIEFIRLRQTSAGRMMFAKKSRKSSNNGAKSTDLKSMSAKSASANASNKSAHVKSSHTTSSPRKITRYKKSRR